MAQRSPEDIKAILDNFGDPAHKMEALQFILNTEEKGADSGSAAKIAELEQLVFDMQNAAEGLKDAPRLNTRERRLYSNMAWSLGFEDAEQLKRRPPPAPEDPPFFYNLPGGEVTNTCEGARNVWRTEAFYLAELITRMHDSADEDEAAAGENAAISWPLKERAEIVDLAFEAAVAVAHLRTAQKVAIAS